MRKLILIVLLLICWHGCENDSSDKSLISSEQIESINEATTSVDTSSDVLNTWSDGDIIFQTSLSSQSEAIQRATKSKYSHIGIVLEEEGEWYVYEAVQPVKMTRLLEWINRGNDNHYVLKRLRQYPGGLNQAQIHSLRVSADQFRGKNYDLHFGWGNESIYCSELVWKMYDEGLGIQLCELRELNEFDLSDPIVKKKMSERYGNQIPMNEQVVSPEDIYQSDLLIEITIR